MSADRIAELLAALADWSAEEVVRVIAKAEAAAALQGLRVIEEHCAASALTGESIDPSAADALLRWRRKADTADWGMRLSRAGMVPREWGRS